MAADRVFPEEKIAKSKVQFEKELAPQFEFLIKGFEDGRYLVTSAEPVVELKQVGWYCSYSKMTVHNERCVQVKHDPVYLILDQDS